jgi:hypothetical protein
VVAPYYTDVFSGEVFVNDDDEEQGRRAHPYGIDIIGWCECFTLLWGGGSMQSTTVVRTVVW